MGRFGIASNSKRNMILHDWNGGSSPRSKSILMLNINGVLYVYSLITSILI